MSVGGDLVWSKLEQGRVPQPKELIPLIMVIYDDDEDYDHDGDENKNDDDN